VDEHEVDTDAYYWNIASDAGRRVAVIDQPQAVPAPLSNGIQLSEWGLHDRNFAVHRSPSTVLDEVATRYGSHPVERCDAHGETTDGYRALRQALLDGVELKTKLILDVLERERWYLFTGTFGESHCVGHQFWHFLDTTHPQHEDAPAEFRDAILSVYQAIDAAVGEIVAAAGARHSIVFASHGMGPKVGGPHLLADVLWRLGMGGHPLSRRALGRVLPVRVKRALRTLLGQRNLTHIPGSKGRGYGDLRSNQKQAAPVRNNRCGGIRINLVGREPFGCVHPGGEADALVHELRTELLALRDPASGEPIVARVSSAEELFGDDHHPDVPDLVVVFRTDLGLLNACESPRVGLVEFPVRRKAIPRTGDHTARSGLWIVGTGVPAGRAITGANVLDIAPTVLQLLDVDPPAGIDGRPLPDLAATS